MKKHAISNAKRLHRLLLPLIVLFIIGELYYLTLPFFVQVTSSFFEKTKLVVAYSAGVALWLTGAWFCCRLLDALLWGVIMQDHFHIRIPRLIQGMVRFLIYFTAFLSILSILFDQSIAGLLATSGALGLVLGLSLENLILDLFSGVVISIDKPFEIGDYIYIYHGGLQSYLRDNAINPMLKVKEISWRSTSFLNVNHDVLIIPNSELSQLTISNFSKANVPLFPLTFILPSNVAVKHAMRLIESASLATEGVLASPKPVFSVDKVTATEIHYTITCAVDMKKTNFDVFLGAVSEHIVQTMARASVGSFGLTQAANDMDAQVRMAIESIDLFQSLSEMELKRVIEYAEVRHYKEGECLVAIDTPGESMFILLEGLLEVLIRFSTEGPLSRVAYLIPQQVLGELSLLTGAPRSATVISKTNSVLIEINKQALAPILKNNPILVERLGQIIAKREKDRLQKTDAFKQKKSDELVEKDVMSQFIDKIKNYFK